MENHGATTLSYQELLLENLRLKGQVKVLSEDVNYLEELVRHLKRQKFGSSSEIVPSGQGTLFNEAEIIVEESERDQKAKPSKIRKKCKAMKPHCLNTPYCLNRHNSPPLPLNSDS